MKRMLNADERKICENALKIKEDEAAYLEYKKEYTEFMLNKGLFQNYKKYVREMNVELINIKKELVEEENHIKVLRTQLKEGVEVKEPKEDN